MEARQSLSLASSSSVESSGSNNTNENKGKKKVKYETWSQAEQKLLLIQFMGWKLRIAREQRGPNRMEENFGRVKLSSRVQQGHGKVYEENQIPN